MAVQAALLSAHPFVPFGFGAPQDGLGGAFGGCFADEERGAAAAAAAGARLSGAEGGDVREATRELLSFMDSASSNIKLALDKPGKSKRKVNHRKYLQKQIKRCGGLVGAGPPSPPGAAPAPAPAPGPGKAAAPPRREAAQAAAAASLQSRSLAALFDSLRHLPGGPEPAGGAPALPEAGPGAARGGGGGAGGGDAAGPAVPGARKVPLRARNLPPSFFTEPSRAAAAAGGGRDGGPSGGGGAGAGAGAGDLEPGAPDAVELFDLLGADYGPGAEPGVLLAAAAAAEPLDVFAAALRGPSELEPGLFEPPPPALVGHLLYPDPWSAPSGPPTKKPPLAAPRGGPGGGLTLTEPLRALYPADGAPAPREDAPGPPAAAPFAPFFPDCALPPAPPPAPYDYGGAGYGRTAFAGLWRQDGLWEGAPGEEGAPRD
ncbi:protein FAM181B [Perognathus longimembris pacificus]|uniref:protein FAM181B n=1 Tax=Perognathus longimembris pacificus TaxID=214514 RepID=UPI00201840B2|nr:protein FAM181B [Perognathus longimembris pacificus]